MSQDPQHHHRRSVRLRGYDYSQAGAYFVTIVCHKRQSLLGKVVDGIVELNPLGRLVEMEWLRVAEVRPYVTLDAFIIMPNHLHDILIISDDITAVAEETHAREDVVENSVAGVPTARPRLRDACHHHDKTSSCTKIRIVGRHNGAVQIQVHKTHQSTARNPRCTCIAAQLLRSYYPGC